MNIEWETVERVGRKEMILHFDQKLILTVEQENQLNEISGIVSAQQRSPYMCYFQKARMFKWETIKAEIEKLFKGFQEE